MIGRAACRVCGYDLAGRWAVATLVTDRAALARQMTSGFCDSCAWLRYQAALEFMAAADELALVIYCGAGQTRIAPRGLPRPHPALTQATTRLRAAEKECVRLKMWPATERSTIQ